MSSSAKLTFADVPWKRNRRISSTRSVGSSRGSTSSRNVRRGSSAETTIGAWYSPPSRSATPVARPSWVMTWSTGDSSLISTPNALRCPGEDLREPAVALLVERPRPELAVVLAEQVVQQHEPGALRVRPDPRADDRGRGHVALEDVRLEVVVEEVRRRAGEQPDRVVEDLPIELPEARAERGEADELLGVVAPEVGRRLVHERLDRLEDLGDVVVERVVGVGVVLRVPRDLLVVLAVVLPEEHVVAVLLRAEGRRHEDRHEAVLHEVELVDDVRAEQAQRVREGREPEARAELLGDRRAADVAAALEHERPQAGLREVGRVRHPVVAGADDDRVVRPRLARRARRRRSLGSRAPERPRRSTFEPLVFAIVRPSFAAG